MAKAEIEKYAENLALYEKLVATNPKVERKGDTMPYTTYAGSLKPKATSRKTAAKKR